MNQHGFARDMEFSLVSQSADEVWFALEDTEETYKVISISLSSGDRI